VGPSLASHGNHASDTHLFASAMGAARKQPALQFLGCKKAQRQPSLFPNFFRLIFIP
jgi:hypothetical protein